jgi:hypothetical protein
MTPKPQPSVRLLTHVRESRCQNCPPERVCAWACAQGTSYPDMLTGAVLEQSRSWALESPGTGADAPDPALWDAFNS